MPWPDAIIVSDTLQPNGWALSVHVSKKKVCTCVCVCVSKRTAGEGREEETLIEIPSAMSGRALVSEWHTHAHIFTLALIKVGFAIWRPCARLASLCSSVCLHLCVCVHMYSAGEPCTAPERRVQMHATLWHVYEGVRVIKTSLEQVHRHLTSYI